MVIYDRPAVFWSFNQEALQLAFLQGLDPEYFLYQAETHRLQLDGTQDLYAATAIRTTYSHALETLFALIGAALQAPACPAGWLLQYKFYELTQLVTSISGEQRLLNRLGLEFTSWSKIAAVTTPWSADEDLVKDHQSATSLLWQTLATDFLSADFQDEYNSIKHGLRVRTGSWFFAMGTEVTPGVPTPPENMKTLSNEKHGSLFVQATYLDRKFQYALRTKRINWNIPALHTRIPYVVHSIQNMISFLLWRNGAPNDDLRGYLLSIAETGEALFKDGFTDGVNLNRIISPDWIEEVSRNEIIRSYPE